MANSRTITINLLEFFYGGDPFSANLEPPVNLQTFKAGHLTHYEYSFKQRLNTAGVTAEFYISHSLTEDTWELLEAPLFTGDIYEEDYLLRTLDLSGQVLGDQPLFVKMKLLLGEENSMLP